MRVCQCIFNWRNCFQTKIFLVVLYYFFVSCFFPSTAINSSRLDGKFINGKELDVEEQRTKKYVAALRTNGTHFCNGCLITATYVLTTGQCIQRFEQFTNYTIDDLTILLSVTSYKALEIEKHKWYNPMYPFETTNYNLGVVLASSLNSLLKISCI